MSTLPPEVFQAIGPVSKKGRAQLLSITSFLTFQAASALVLSPGMPLVRFEKEYWSRVISAPMAPAAVSFLGKLK